MARQVATPREAQSLNVGTGTVTPAVDPPEAEPAMHAPTPTAAVRETSGDKRKRHQVEESEPSINGDGDITSDERDVSVGGQHARWYSRSS